MFPKVLLAIVAAAAVGAGVLALRQQRLALRHEMALLHREMDQARRETWRLQAGIAERASPEAIRVAVERHGLELEPILPGDIVRPNDPSRLVRGAEALPGEANGGVR